MITNLGYEVFSGKTISEVKMSYDLQGSHEPIVERIVFRTSADGKGAVRISHPTKGLVHSIIVDNLEEGKNTLVEQAKNRLKELGWTGTFEDLEVYLVSSH